MNSPSREQIDKAINGPMNVFESDKILADAYREAIKALREATVEEEEYLEIYSGELDPEHRHVLKEQIKEHNKIIDKYPEEI